MIEKDLDQVKVETETSETEENFDSEMTWENEVDIELDNILSDYNPAKALAAKAEATKQTYQKQSVRELLIDYANIIYTDMKELAKTNIIQHTIHLFNLILIVQKCCSINQRNRN